ncbi:S8 family anti-phage peptidase IteS [Dyella tabacisoli]|uniref:Peptidase n=1 Tax=Dyella tabacisoli TaxID=2282381 RepID=A0A369UJ58_9GAMM|nr:S8 family anti-phage peptidase IteS [Dyella tabacisoli]RDD80383.1 peptidase [Dyella tabacisoli]
MARKARSNNHPRPQADNPFVHVAFSPGDVFGVEVTGGGAKQFCNTDAEYRAKLNRTVAAAGGIVGANALKYPGIPTVLSFRMRPEAIAKSHRPLNLVAEADMPVIGHAALDEMLVEATPREIGLLSTVVAERDTKVLRANLSAVSEVAAWDAQAKLPPPLRGGSLDATRDMLRATGRIWIKLFRYRNEVVQAATVTNLDAILRAGKVAGQVLHQAKGPPVYIIDAGATLSNETLDELLEFPGIRSVAPEPRAAAEPGNAAQTEVAQSTFERNPPPDAPIVAVFDTGVHPSATLLAPWVSSTETFITPVDTDYAHGTMVASLVADARGLNEQHASFPLTACRVHDVCGLESSSAQIGDLIIRLRQALANRPDIRVWNLSLGSPFGVGDDGFSDLAQELDGLSDRYNVLFVVAAGNYVTEPRRGWPCDDSFEDRISSPADSVRALTVGAITHIGSPVGYVAAGEPASYSRRGPGPVFTPKPDVVHVGGGLETPWTPQALGIKVLHPDNSVARGAGTSFAAPIVAAMAAQTWHALGTAPRQHGLSPSPTLIKALMIHSAELASPPRTPLHRRYYGAGVPSDPMMVLYDGPDSFTLVFEADLSPGTKWRKAPYPIPPSLLVAGKFRGEVVMTAVYAPPLDGAAGAEYVRANVELGFGLLEPDEDGELQFNGQVPMKGEEGTDGLEKAQVEHGGKWSPVKIHRRVFAGVTGASWALQASMMRRANEPTGQDPLRTIIIVTLRSVDGHNDIYNEGVRALAALNWITQPLPVSVPINITVR